MKETLKSWMQTISYRDAEGEDWSSRPTDRRTSVLAWSASTKTWSPPSGRELALIVSALLRSAGRYLVHRRTTRSRPSADAART